MYLLFKAWKINYYNNIINHYKENLSIKITLKANYLDLNRGNL